MEVLSIVVPRKDLETEKANAVVFSHQKGAVELDSVNNREPS